MKTNNAYVDFDPAFSPDGSHIAFSSNRAIFGQWNLLRLVPFAWAVTDTEMGVYRTLLSDDNTDWLSRDTLRAMTPAAGPDDSVIFIAFDDSEQTGVQRPVRRLWLPLST